MNKLENLLSDDAFIEKLSAVDSIAALQTLCAAHGAAVTEEDLHAFSEGMPEETGELEQEALDEVAGGRLMSPSGPISKKRVDNMTAIIRKLLRSAII